MIGTANGYHVSITGLGAALPERVVTNADLVERLDTSDEWIVRRTGIRTRRWLGPGEPLAPLAARACAEALADAGRSASEVDHVIVSTVTPDRLMPGLAPGIAELIGTNGAGAVDVNAACAGFMYALDQAAAQVESGRARVVLVCGAEALSRITDRNDRGTAILFADGAAARDALQNAGIRVIAERDVVVQRLKQAVPGQLGQLTGRMAEAGVNIEVLYSDHDHRLILVVDDVEKARRVSEEWARDTRP